MTGSPDSSEDPPGSRRGWRKFALASFFAIASTAALFAGKLDAHAYVELAGAVLFLYGGSNVLDKRLGGLG